jgi:hypothetical protein
MEAILSTCRIISKNIKNIKIKKMYKTNTTRDIAELVLSAMMHSNTHTIHADDDPQRLVRMIELLLSAPEPEYPGHEWAAQQLQQEE